MSSTHEFHHNAVEDSEATQLPPLEDGPHLESMTNDTSTDQAAASIPDTTTQATPAQKMSSRQQWLYALKQVTPIYIATHLAFLVLTYVGSLFNIPNYSRIPLNPSTLLQAWNRWDTTQFIEIATKGYTAPWRTAFFPLYPLLEYLLTLLTHNPLVSGLIISNLAGFAMLVALYRLVEQDIDTNTAYRTVLYLAVFPTAFFFASAYNESLFLCFTLFSFYAMRRGNWWIAGLFGLLASLTRSGGILLLVPFLYEYLHQHSFNARNIRIGIVGGILIPVGTGLFALYCYVKFQNALAFSQAQLVWLRGLHGPWHGPLDSFLIIIHHGILSFDGIHNAIDLGAALVTGILLVLCFVGPWKLARNQWAYSFYALVSYVFFLLLPAAGSFPLESFSRLVLELFPAFIILGKMGKNSQFSLYYLTISIALLAFLTLQFVTGYWIV